MNQLKFGIKTELEHKKTYRKMMQLCKKGKCPTDKAISKMVALDHLKEDPNYYKKLKKYKL